MTEGSSDGFTNVLTDTSTFGRSVVLQAFVTVSLGNDIGIWFAGFGGGVTAEGTAVLT